MASKIPAIAGNQYRDESLRKLEHKKREKTAIYKEGLDCPILRDHSNKYLPDPN
jgi:hypothetical protein